MGRTNCLFYLHTVDIIYFLDRTQNLAKHLIYKSVDIIYLLDPWSGRESLRYLQYSRYFISSLIKDNVEESINLHMVDIVYLLNIPNTLKAYLQYSRYCRFPKQENSSIGTSISTHSRYYISPDS